MKKCSETLLWHCEACQNIFSLEEWDTAKRKCPACLGPAGLWKCSTCQGVFGQPSLGSEHPCLSNVAPEVTPVSDQIARKVQPTPAVKRTGSSQDRPQVRPENLLVSWSVIGALTLNHQARLELVFQNCHPDGDVSLPFVSGLKIIAPAGRGYVHSDSHGGVLTTFAFSVMPIRSGKLTIPDFRIQTNQGLQTVPRLVLNAVDLPSLRSPETPAENNLTETESGRLFSSVESEHLALRILLFVLMLAGAAFVIWFNS